MRQQARPHVHIAQRLTVPITKRVFGTTYFWNPLQNFLLAKFKCASRVPSCSRSPGSAPAAALCLLERSNIYIFVISYLKPIRRLDTQKNQQVF